MTSPEQSNIDNTAWQNPETEQEKKGFNVGETLKKYLKIATLGIAVGAGTDMANAQNKAHVENVKMTHQVTGTEKANAAVKPVHLGHAPEAAKSEYTVKHVDLGVDEVRTDVNVMANKDLLANPSAHGEAHAPEIKTAKMETAPSGSAPIVAAAVDVKLGQNIPTEQVENLKPKNVKMETQHIPPSSNNTATAEMPSIPSTEK